MGSGDAGDGTRVLHNGKATRESEYGFNFAIGI